MATRECNNVSGASFRPTLISHFWRSTGREDVSCGNEQEVILSDNVHDVVQPTTAISIESLQGMLGSQRWDPKDLKRDLETCKGNGIYVS